MIFELVILNFTDASLATGFFPTSDIMNLESNTNEMRSMKSCLLNLELSNTSNASN